MLPNTFIFSSNLFHTGLFKLITTWIKITFDGKGSLVLK